MTYPTWTPAQLITLIEDYDALLQTSKLAHEDTAELQRRASMWARLATRKEMERVWLFIAGADGLENLQTNGGLAGRIDRAMTSFQMSPRLSKADYKAEILEISQLANALSNKLQKFCASESVQNFFRYGSLLEKQHLEGIKNIIRPELLKHRHGFTDQMAIYALDESLPSIHLQIKSLGQNAKSEAADQAYRLRLPRKTNDKNTFRTYFIRIISDHFFINFADFSPTRIAIFCGVALDDPEITADLVRKLYVLDEDMKSMLKAHREHKKAEDL
jgi:hypothetical protein